MIKLRNLFFIIAITFFIVKQTSPQNNSFILSTSNFHPYFPTYLGNGHFSLSSSQTGTLPADSYMIKVYDHGEDDIPRIANLPAWNEINYFNGREWLNDSLQDTSNFRNFYQELNMFNGSLESSYKWISDDRETDINVFSFISRKNDKLAVIRFELSTNFSDTVTLSFPLEEQEHPKRMPLARLEKVDANPPGKWPAEWYPGHTEIVEINGSTDNNGGEINALAQTEGRNTQVAVSSDIFFEGEIARPQISFKKDDKGALVEIKFLPEKNRRYSFFKIISIVSGFENRNDITKEARTICSNARQDGFSQLFAEHKKEWNRLWETDIILEGAGHGADRLQKIVHSMMFYLLCSIDENTSFSIPPMGLATAGYYGHIFWDADTYMFPPLLFMFPELAKSMIMFRVNTLEAAKQNAKKNDYEGAMYPWEADERGEETTPFFAYQNALQENHINGDVALAQWQYFLATKDTNWLREHGSKVIEGTADFWKSRVHFNEEKDRYEIGKLVSVSEGLIGINNETYTNTIAKINLELAVKVGKILNKQVDTEWEKISKKMFIPYNEEEEYHPTYEEAGAGEGATELWSSVVNLLSYPLQVEMSENAKRNNLIHAVNSLGESGAGAMMGTNFVAIIAAELNMDSLFNAVIKNTLFGYLRPPFNVLAETHNNNSINFITGAGSFLQQVIFGYTGLRLTEDGLVEKFNPLLPENIKSLTLKNFTIGNKKNDIIIENNKLKMSPK